MPLVRIDLIQGESSEAAIGDVIYEAMLAILNVLVILSFVATGANLGFVLNLLFAGVLVALLLHPQSRHYERIWFK